MKPTQSTPPITRDEASITDALDDAVAMLQAATGATARDPLSQSLSQSLSQPVANDPSTLTQSTSDGKATLDVVESMCGATDRRQALERLVHAITPVGTKGTVRAGMGGKRMKWLFDSRLGWIGSGSALFDQVAVSWNTKSASDPDQKATEVQTIQLPAPGGQQRCQVWVHDDPAAVRWLAPVTDTIASVLWSRPARKMPFSSTQANQGHRTSWVFGAVALSVLVLAAWPVPYRVACNVTVETTSERYIAAPFEARLLQVHVRPGEKVVAGQTLLELDGRPLRLQHEALQAQWQQAVKEHDVALASRRIADAQQSALHQKKLRRKMQLITDRLGRLQVNSPIAGVVVSGDLHRHIGSPLELGQNLMEIASMDRVTLELEIPEHEIGFVTPDMDTRVKIDAVGGHSMDLALQEIYPAAELRDDQNIFVGRIEVENPDGTLRPGMRGKAIAYGPVRPWIWSWVRGAFERCLWWAGY